MNPIKPAILTLLAATFLTSCTALFSTVDKTRLIWTHQQDITQTKTPTGFVVTPQEIHECIPITKWAWNIYADSENYYLSGTHQKLTSKTGDNSHIARTRGIRISGITRTDIEKAQSARTQNPAFNRIIHSQNALREALNQSH